MNIGTYHTDFVKIRLGSSVAIPLPGGFTQEENPACRGVAAEIAEERLIGLFSESSAVKCHSATSARN